MKVNDMVKYVLEAEIPTLKCMECGNNSDFSVVFNESILEIEYVAGKRPVIVSWTDTGKDFEVTCNNCGSQDVEVDEFFFG